MADTTVALDLTIDSNAEQVLNKGTEAYRQFREETRKGLGDLLNLKKGTEEYNIALSKLASHKAEFQELQKQLAAVNPNRLAGNFAEFAQRATNALQGLGGAATLVAGGNEKMIETFVKTQALVQVLNSLADLQKLKLEANAIWLNIVTVAQKAWNAAINAWPVSLLIAGITAIIAAVEIWNGKQESIIAEQEKIIENLKKTRELYNASSDAIKGHLQNELDLLIAQNAEYDKIEKAKKRVLDAETDKVKFDLENQRRQNTALQKEADAHKKETHYWRDILGYAKNFVTLGANVTDNYTKNIEEQKQFNDAVEEGNTKALALQNTLEKLTIVDPTKASEEKAKAEREAMNKIQRVRDESLKESRTKQLRLLSDQHKEDLEGLDKKGIEYNALKLAYDNKYYIERKRLFDKFKQQDQDTRDEYERTKLEDLDKANTALIAYYDKETAKNLKNAIDGGDLEILQLQKNHAKKRDIIEAEYRRDIVAANENAVAIEQANKKKNDALLANDQETANVRVQIATNIGNALVGIGQLLLKEGEKQTDGTKALALIQLGINEAVAIGNVVANATNPLSPMNVATGGIAAIANIAAGVASVVATFVQAKSILDGGSDGSSTSTGSPSFSAGTTTAPSFSSTQFGDTPKRNKNGNTDYGYDAMSKIYITQTDLNQSQQLAYIQNARRRIK